MSKPKYKWRPWLDLLEDQGFKLKEINGHWHAVTPKGHQIPHPTLLVKAGILLKRYNKHPKYTIWDYETFDNIVDGLMEN